MSELKAFRIIQGDTGGYGAPSYKCDTDGNRIEEWGDICEVYDKYEADKVIAHHKYKRCVAMAKWCERKRIDAANYRIPRQKWDFYDKWQNRCLELAEKFKEADDA